MFFFSVVSFICQTRDLFLFEQFVSFCLEGLCAFVPEGFCFLFFFLLYLMGEVLFFRVFFLEDFVFLFVVLFISPLFSLFVRFLFVCLLFCLFFFVFQLCLVFPTTSLAQSNRAI